MANTFVVYLGDGATILFTRGPRALFGAIMLEVTQGLDKKNGPFLPLHEVRRLGPHLVRAVGFRKATAAVTRHLAFVHYLQGKKAAQAKASAAPPPSLQAPDAYHYTYDLVLPDGVVPSRRLRNEDDFALETPFRFTPAIARTQPVAAVIHAFYPEILPSILARLENVPVGVDLFVSTDSGAKEQKIARATASWGKGSVDIRVLPNRGRDVAATFVGFRDVYDRYDLFIHLHTKKSPHGGDPLESWRDYLVDSLIGDVARAQTSLSLFEDPRIGVVFPQHLFALRGVLNWGYDYDLARGLLARMGIGIDKNIPLEFPSGSMFWARSDAIRPLLALGLSYEDFHPEDGQVDGTLAHAIERILLIIAEGRGYEWLKIGTRSDYPLPQTILPVHRPGDIADHRPKIFQPCLSDVDTTWPLYAASFVTARPLPAYPSRNLRPRINLLVPTVNPAQTFGGIATALRLFERLAEALGPDFDRRIVVTDAEIQPEGFAALPRYKRIPFAPSADTEPAALVDCSARDGRLDLRAGDVFMATAWWTATQEDRLRKAQGRFFGTQGKFVYLIQDDEPFFYGWGNEFTLAENTYRNGERTIAIINSQELFAEMQAKYEFAHTFCLPWKLNESIAGQLRPQKRERIVLVYARPSVARNLYGLICAGLFLWQQRDPIRASRWTLVLAGEQFDPKYVHPLKNVRIAGKLDLNGYADLLNRASVGLSLMASPHPSYPPLEMATAGLRTIANNWGAKDPAARFPDILSLDDISPESIASAVERCVADMEPQIGQITPARQEVPQPDPAPLDMDMLADLVRRDALQRIEPQEKRS